MSQHLPEGAVALKTDASGRSIAPVVELSSYEDASEVWRCPHMSTVAVGIRGHDHFHTGTVNHLHGSEHAVRRRALGQLLKRRGHRYFRDTYLFPTCDSALDDVLANPGQDGRPRMELASWSRQVNQRLAAGLVGLDGATSREGGYRLYELMGVYHRGRPTNESVVTGSYDPDDELAQRALQARNTIIEEFYRPSMARRLSLLDQVAAGKMSEDDLPQDMLTLIARRLDPAWQAEADAQRDAMSMLSAAVRTTTLTLSWALLEIYAWRDAHPEQAGRLGDDAFLLRAIQESMRLHPAIPAFPRAALEDVELASGTTVEQGSIVIIRGGPGSVSPEVYGADALEFDPDRTVPPGTNRYGLSFGAGSHSCYGMPIVMGAEGIDGSLVYLVRSLLAAQAELDPDFGQPVSLTDSRGTFVSLDKFVTGSAGVHLVFPPAGSAD
jgi:cytochrome P450